MDEKLQQICESWAWKRLQEMGEGRYPDAPKRGYFRKRVEERDDKFFCYLGYGSDYWEDGFVLSPIGNGLGKMMANAKKGVFTINYM